MYYSELLDRLYAQYNLKNLKFGILGDKLGDCFEDFVVTILQNTDYLSAFNKGIQLEGIEFDIFYQILMRFSLSNQSGISNIKATSKIQSRITGGLPKTDVIADIQFADRTVVALPISVKQSTVPKVAFAEFDVNTIVKEIGITDEIVIALLRKHQEDASAKNFTAEEKNSLTLHLAPYASRFVQWVITGAPNESADLRIPKCIVKFDVKKESYAISNYTVYSISQYVDSIMKNKNGTPCSGGFGTGLSWTYATGSKGKKIQFKG